MTSPWQGGPDGGGDGLNGQLRAQLLQTVQDLERDYAMREEEAKREWEQFEEEKRKAREKIETDRGTHEDRVRWEKERLREEKQDFEEMKKRSVAVADGKEQLITIEVGGVKFKTDSKTLRRHTNSIFPDVLRIAQQAPSHTARGDYIFIDRDGKHFQFILNFMRQGEEVMRGTALRNADQYVLHEMLCEVRYYKLKQLESLLQRHQVRLERKVLTFLDLVKEKYVQLTGQNYYTTQQLLLTSQNLKGIVFEKVLFRHPVSFAGSILEGAKFKQCAFQAAVNFTGADLYRVSFENCMGVSPDRFNLDGEAASRSHVTFNPPLDFALTNFSNCY